MIAAASNALAQAAAVDQAMKAEAVMAVVEAEAGTDRDLTNTERYLISRNNSLRNPCSPSMTKIQG